MTTLSSARTSRSNGLGPLTEVVSFVEEKSTTETLSFDINRPRLLTKEEIDDIIQVIPAYPPYEIRVKFPEIAQHIQNGIRDRLRYLLGQIKLTPLAIEDMKQRIFNQYEETVIQAGRAVGPDAGGAFGEIMGQSTLNTFHLAGVKSNVTGGIKGFQELINAKKIRSFESSTLHFKDNQLDLRGILEIRDELAHVTVDQLVDDINLINPPDPDSEEYPYWYTVYLETHEQIILNSSWILRINLKLDLMYVKGITMGELCKVIEAGCPPTVVCIPSPFNLAIIDIHAIDSNIESYNVAMSVPERERAFLSISCKSKLNEISIRGIPGITDLTPTFFRVWETVLKESYLGQLEIRVEEGAEQSRYLVRRKWLLSLDERKFKISSLTVDNIIRLVKIVGIEVNEVHSAVGLLRTMIVTMPEVAENPLNYIKEALKQLRQDNKLSDQSGRLANHLIAALADSYTYQDEQWLIALNDKYLLEKEVSALTVLNLLNEISIKARLLKTIDNKFYLAVTILPGLTPTSLVQKTINDDRIDEERLRKRGTPRPASEIKKASRYYFAFTVGNNLPELLQLNIINPKYTYSNNAHHILEAFGIEATRNFLIREFLEVIKNEGAINIQHVMLLVDYMTRTGSITKVNAPSVKNRPFGTFAKMTTSKALEVLLTAAAFGTKDPREMKEVSAAIMVGELVNIGTGYGNYANYNKALKQLREELRTGRTLRLSPEETEQAIQETMAVNQGLVSTISEENRGKLEMIPQPTNQLTQLTDEVPLETETNLADVIPGPRTINDHLLTVLNQIQYIPCEPQVGEVVYIQPQISSSLHTTQLPLTRISTELVEEEEEIIATFQLPLPHPSTSLSIPQTLVEEIDAASKIQLPTVISREKPQPVDIRPVFRPKIQPPSIMPSLAPLPARKPPAIIIESPAVTVAQQLAEEKVTIRSGLVPQPKQLLPARGLEPTAVIGGFGELLKGLD